MSDCVRVRVQPPERSGAPVTFKPGTSTWSTDDPSQAAPWVRAQVQLPAPNRMPACSACDKSCTHAPLEVTCRAFLHPLMLHAVQAAAVLPCACTTTDSGILVPPKTILVHHTSYMLVSLKTGAMAVQMRKELEAGTWRGQAKGEAAGAAGPKKPVPAPYMSAQYKEDAMRTTGMLCLCWKPFHDLRLLASCSLWLACTYGRFAVPTPDAIRVCRAVQLQTM